MDVLIVGSGGREHALALSLAECESVNHVHSCPGNAGTVGISGSNHQVDAMDIEGIINLALNLSVDLVVVGPESPLVAGLSDRLNEVEFHVLGLILKGLNWKVRNYMQKRSCNRLMCPQQV